MFCEAYCAMAAVHDGYEMLCEAQRILIRVMRDNPPVTATIANSYLEFLGPTTAHLCD